MAIMKPRPPLAEVIGNTGVAVGTEARSTLRTYGSLLTQRSL
jgi:hypothetical protein